MRCGFPVNDDALGVEVIAAAMDGSRNFLGQKHSIKYMRAGEILITHLAERRPWEGWDREGREGMAHRSNTEAERFIAEHEVPPLTDDQEKDLDMIMEEARGKLVKE